MERDLGKEMEQDLENEAVLDQIRKDAESVELPERLSPEHMKEMILAEEAAAGSAEAPQTEEIPERRKPMWRKALIGITAAAASLAVIVGSASVISRQGKGTGSLASGNDPASWVASVEDKNEDGAAQLAGEMIETEADETVETAMAELADSPAVTEEAPAAEAEPDTSWSLAATLKLPAGLDISATYKGIYQKLAASGALDFLRADRRAAVSRGYYFTNGMSIDAVAEEEDAMEAPAAAENFNTASNADTVAKGDTGMAVTASGMGGDEEAVEDDAAGDSSEWSTTNTRTENVDESDIVKTDGRFIYRLTSSDEGGKVVKIVHAEQGKVWAASEVRLEQDQENEWSNYDDMFLQDGKLILIGTKYTYSDYPGDVIVYNETVKNDTTETVEEDAEETEPAEVTDPGADIPVKEGLAHLWNNDVETIVRIYDVSDPENPSFLTEHTQSGNLRSARLMNGVVYLISQAGAETWWRYPIVYNDIDEEEILYDDAVEEDASDVPDTEDAPETTPASDGSDKESDTADAAAGRIIPGIIESENDADYEEIVPKADGEPIPADHIIMPEGDSEGINYIIITTLRLGETEQFAEKYAVLTRTSDEVYMTMNSLYMWRTNWDWSWDEEEQFGRQTVDTFLMKFAVNDGTINPAATATIPGYLNNTWSIDEYNGALRMVVTEYVEPDPDDEDQWSTEINALYVLDEDLKTVGEIRDIAKGELIKSARFFGDVGYFVTFRQTDPLFSVDLSDRANPVIIGELKIPGFSEYLHSFGDGLLLGLGQEADIEEGGTEGLKLSMFDVSDPAAVRELTKTMPGFVQADSFGSNSSAEYDHKAITVSAGKNVIGFEMSIWWRTEGTKENGYSYSYSNQSFYVVYGYSEEQGFYERFRAPVSQNTYWGALRGLFIGDYYYVVTESEIVIFDLNQDAEIGRYEF